MKFNNSRLVDHKPMKFGTFVPYMYHFEIIVKYLTNFFKLEWNLGIKFTLRFFFLSVYFNLKITRSVGKQFARNKRVSLAIQHTIQVQWSILKYTWDKTKGTY